MGGRTLRRRMMDVVAGAASTCTNPMTYKVTGLRHGLDISSIPQIGRGGGGEASHNCGDRVRDKQAATSCAPLRQAKRGGSSRRAARLPAAREQLRLRRDAEEGKLSSSHGAAAQPRRSRARPSVRGDRTGSHRACGRGKGSPTGPAAACGRWSSATERRMLHDEWSGSGRGSGNSSGAQRQL
eukprot:scaffold86717_cov28-Tisochrysis_lutea.AAC.7